MRVLVLGLALLALVPPATAQTEGALTIEMAPPAGPLMPGAAPTEVPIVVRGDCAPATAVPPGLVVRFAIERQPAWADAVVEPDSFSIRIEDCAGGSFTREARLHVSASELAPAFAPEVIDVEVRATWPGSPERASRYPLPVTAGYAGVVDVQAVPEALPGEHGVLVIFPLKLTNLANGNTKVVFDLARADTGLRVGPPPPAILQSRHAGGTAFTAMVPVQAARMMAAGEETLSFTLSWRSHYFLDAALEGASGTIQLRVLPPSAASSMEVTPEDVNKLPGLGTLGALLSMLVVSVLRRRA